MKHKEKEEWLFIEKHIRWTPFPKACIFINTGFHQVLFSVVFNLCYEQLLLKIYLDKVS